MIATLPWLFALTSCLGSTRSSPVEPAGAVLADVPFRPSPDIRVYDFRPEHLVDPTAAGVVEQDPMRVLFTHTPPPEEPAEVAALMARNPQVFAFLPAQVREREAVQAQALALGLPAGVRITVPVDARVSPDPEAVLSLYASDTTNGYVSREREHQSLEVGALVVPLETRTLGETTWHQVTRGVPSTRAADQALWEECSNVGGIAFDDFTLSIDPGWIPASATTPAVVAPLCGTGLYTFEGVENGDLAVYVSFQEASFADFSGLHYTLLTHAESGDLVPGAQVRVVWCDDDLEWLPFE